MAGIEPITVSEIKAFAKKKLSKPVWDYYATGADDESTVVSNEAIYDRLYLRPRVLRNVSIVDTSTMVLGTRYTMPIAIAPSAYQRLAGDGGEIDMARAACKLGTTYILSSNATTTLEAVMAACHVDGLPGPQLWFQLYVLQNRDIAKELMKRAEKSGYKALIITVDTPVMGNRLHERRSPLVLPSHLTLANLTSRKGTGASKGRLLLNARTATEAAEIAQAHVGSFTDATLTWRELIPWLRVNTGMKLIIKGIMTAEDAALAVEAGCDAIVVSNHGGRQLDGVSSTLEALPEIVDTVQGKIPVVFDGGIRKGSDVFKALALGADLCLVGRSALYGLGYNGQEGVEGVLHILERELTRTMALMGTSTISAISRSMLGVRRKGGFGIAKL